MSKIVLKIEYWKDGKFFSEYGGTCNVMVADGVLDQLFSIAKESIKKDMDNVV